MQRAISFVALIATVLMLHTAMASAAMSCFQQTDACLTGSFAQYWTRNGGLAVFGFPINDQRQEQGTQGVFSTQWFERERFEAHPENHAPYDVLLGRLGDEALRRSGRIWQ